MAAVSLEARAQLTSRAPRLLVSARPQARVSLYKPV